MENDEPLETHISTRHGTALCGEEAKTQAFVWLPGDSTCSGCQFINHLRVEQAQDRLQELERLRQVKNQWAKRPIELPPPDADT